MTNADERHLQRILQNVKALSTELQTNRMESYEPYLKQLDFHAMGIDKTERLLSAGNQLGKTWAGAHEAAFHATGRYPEWWPGRTWDRPTRGWVCGESGLVVRDTSQKLLLGDVTEGEEKIGTGTIPRECIHDFTWSRGVAQAIDTLVVKHESGGKSVIKFKSYEQQRIKWQGDTIDWGWCDEEPPPDLYSELLARLTATRGMAFTTFTPLKGMSTVVKRFKHEANEFRGEVIMTAHDAPHISEDHLREMLSKYPEHEHECRINGVPMAGEGRIFTVSESLVKCEPFEIPDHFTHVVGLDIGHGDHPTAGAWLAIDRDTDIMYVYRSYRNRDGRIPNHASALQSGGRIPIAWPHDAKSKDRGPDGLEVREHYQKAGCYMLPHHAQFKDGSNKVWQGIVEMQRRLEDGRLKVFANLSDWFEEYRQYHLDDGKIVDVDDDLLCATRYAIMMARYAKTIDRNWYPGRQAPLQNNIAPGGDFDVFS